jgi:hypothetical protein
MMVHNRLLNGTSGVLAIPKLILYHYSKVKDRQIESAIDYSKRLLFLNNKFINNNQPILQEQSSKPDRLLTI